MSNIEFSQIDDTFPIAGQNNDTQGFRNNFNYIKTALEVAYTEIDALQSKTIKSSALESNAQVVNDLNGSSLVNGAYTTFYGKSNKVVTDSNSANTLYTVNVATGALQEYTLTKNATLSFASWPVDGLYANIRLHIKSDGTGTYTATLDVGTNTIVYASDFPAELTVTDKHQVIEVWTYTAGDLVYVKHIGEF